MRYYALRQAPRHPLFRWFKPYGRGGWVDLDGAEMHGLLVLFGEGAGGIALGLRDADGRSVPLHVTPPAEDADLPDGARFFLGKPAAERQVVDLRFAFPDARPLVLTGDSIPLAVLSAEINFPAHIFTMVQRYPDTYETFVETGTLFGHTSLQASYWFDRVVTIELSEALHAMAEKSLAHRPNVTCLRGNSGAVLERLVTDLDRPTFFFLDAHFSGDDSTDWSKSRFSGYPVETARIDDPTLTECERQVPLLRELELIAEHFKAPALIMIDDWSAPGQLDVQFDGEDWTGVDPEALKAMMATHPRTLEHYSFGVERYIWRIGPLV